VATVALVELASWRLLDQTHCFDAQDPWEHHARRKTLPGEQLRAVEPKCLDPDQNLSRLWRGDRAALDFEDFRPARFVDNRSLHHIHG
jgi:hypothetical protein